MALRDARGLSRLNDFLALWSQAQMPSCNLHVTSTSVYMAKPGSASAPRGHARLQSDKLSLARTISDRFRAPRCSSFLPAPDAPIRRICARSDRVEELSYLHRPSLRRGIRDCAGHGRTAETPWAVPGLPVPGGVTPTGHAYGEGCTASLCKSPAHEGQHLGFEPSGEEPVAGLSLRAWNRCSPPWGEMLGAELSVRLGGCLAGWPGPGGVRGARRSRPAGVGGGGRWGALRLVAAALHRDRGVGRFT